MLIEGFRMIFNFILLFHFSIVHTCPCVLVHVSLCVLVSVSVCVLLSMSMCVCAGMLACVLVCASMCLWVHMHVCAHRYLRMISGIILNRLTSSVRPDLTVKLISLVLLVSLFWAPLLRLDLLIGRSPHLPGVYVTSGDMSSASHTCRAKALLSHWAISPAPDQVF
jgi:hypothetical protein